MAKRIKPGIPLIADLAQADQALRELAEIERERARIEAEMNADVDAAKARAKEALEAPMARKRELETALAAYSTINKASLFDKARSLDMAFGVIGWRRSTSLKTAAKVTWDMVLGRLKELGKTLAIRTREEPDKEELARWSDEDLEAVGVRRAEKDEFYITIKQAALNEAA